MEEVLDVPLTPGLTAVLIGDVTLPLAPAVVAAMRELIPAVQDFCGCRLCVEDVYAIALNSLPAHYVQSGSLVLRRAPPSDDDVQRAVADALDRVRVRPNHPDVPDAS